MRLLFAYVFAAGVLGFGGLWIWRAGLGETMARRRLLRAASRRANTLKLLSEAKCSFCLKECSVRTDAYSSKWGWFHDTCYLDILS